MTRICANVIARFCSLQWAICSLQRALMRAISTSYLLEGYFEQLDKGVTTLYDYKPPRRRL
jgi:hypothetical protein